MVESKSRFTEKAAKWYAYRSETKKGKKVELVPNGQVFDIVYHSKRRPRFIEVKGMHNEHPVAFRIFGSARKHNDWLRAIPMNSRKYFVYLIYNIRLNKRPRLVILNSKFIREHSHWVPKEHCLHVLGVRAGIEDEGIGSYELLPKLTPHTKKLVRNFFQR